MLRGDKDKPLPYGYDRTKWASHCGRVVAYKDLLSREFSRGQGGESKVMAYEKFIASMAGREVVLTIKYDGELNCCVWEQGGRPDGGDLVAWFNKYPGGAGKMRADIKPLSDEFADAMKRRGLKQAYFMGELYALSPEGKPLPLGDTASIILKPVTPQREAQIHYAVFDILDMDGKPVEDDYWKKCLLIQDIFKGYEHVHAVFAKRGDQSVAETLWKEKILDEGYEGFVVRSNGTIKVKPKFDFDMAVVGFVVGPDAKTWDSSGGTAIKTLVLAWIDSDGTYRYSCNVGNGVDAKEQRDLAKMLVPKVVQKDVRLQDNIIYMVEPSLVVCVDCAEVYPPRQADAWTWDDKKKEWNFVGQKTSAAIRFPTYAVGPKKFRFDKDAKKYLDCRIDQIPEWGEPTSPPPATVTEVAVEEPGAAEPVVVPKVAEKAVMPLSSKFKVGDGVSLKNELGPGFEVGKEGVVKEVRPPTGRSPTASYNVTFDGKDIVLGESLLGDVESDKMDMISRHIGLTEEHAKFKVGDKVVPLPQKEPVYTESAQKLVGKVGVVGRIGWPGMCPDDQPIWVDFPSKKFSWDGGCYKPEWLRLATPKEATTIAKFLEEAEEDEKEEVTPVDVEGKYPAVAPSPPVKKNYNVRCNKCGRTTTWMRQTSPPTKCDYSTCKDSKKQDLTIEKEWDSGPEFTPAGILEKVKESIAKDDGGLPKFTAKEMKDMGLVATTIPKYGPGRKVEFRRLALDAFEPGTVVSSKSGSVGPEYVILNDRGEKVEDIDEYNMRVPPPSMLKVEESRLVEKTEEHKGVAVKTGLRCRGCGKDCLKVEGMDKEICGCDKDYDDYLKVAITDRKDGIPVEELSGKKKKKTVYAIRPLW